MQGNSTILEGFVIGYALHTIRRYNLQANVIECDNQSIVNKITRKGEMDIRRMMVSMVCEECRCIPREANKVAHYIAHEPNIISIIHNSDHVLSFIELDSEALH